MNALHLNYLEDRWDPALTEGMEEADLLVYRSNLLGADRRLTNYGGGNTSAKIPQPDPLTGETVTVLWVKGSGGDLGTIRREGFATLYQDRLEGLKRRYRGVEQEDEMVDLYPWCGYAGGGRPPSIDTPLHAFLPFRHVDHLHPDWAIALAASANGPQHLKTLEEATGIKLVWLPWKRPGFELGLWLEKAVRENPEAEGILLGSHGLFTWGETSRASYENTLRVLDAIGGYVIPKIEQEGDRLFGGARFASVKEPEELAAALLPVLRGQINGGSSIGHYDSSPETLRFVNSQRAEALAWKGTSCPDHFVRTKVRPMYIRWDPAGDRASLLETARASFPAYREEYTRYYQENCRPDSPAMRAPEPTVVLVPGLGMFSFGRSKAEARITGEFYLNAIHVMEGATALAGNPLVDNYVSLPPEEAFNIEYWSLEEAKLRRMPLEKELSRKVAVVIGVSPGIGQSVALRLAREGAHLVCADLREDLAHQAAKAVQAIGGPESAVALTVDATDRQSLRRLYSEVALAYGGLDTVAVVVGAFFPPDEATGRITDDQWKRTFEINVQASYLAADEAKEFLTRQGSGGSILLFTSANAVVAKRGSFAYDTSKAAVSHLVRELAVECAPQGIRVNGIAPASVVEGSLQFPRERVITSLAKYKIAFKESETTEALREKLANFYAQRTLLKKPVTPAAIAEAALLLAGPRLALTTGQVLPVDAGLPEAFLR